MGNDHFISRRAFLYHGACLVALGTHSRMALADIQLGTSARISTLSDGYLTLPPGMIFGAMPQEELKVILAGYQTDLTRYEPECNVVLYRDGENTVLFDVGAGADFMPTSGKLLDSLDAIDLSLVLGLRGIDGKRFSVKLLLPKRNKNEAGAGYGKNWSSN